MFADTSSSSPVSSSSSSSSSAPSMDFASLKNTLSQGGQHLGDVVWWMLSGADVPRSVLETKWLAAGLDAKFMPAEQTPEKALRLAVKSAGTGLGDSRQGTLVRPTLDTENALIYAVVHEGHDANGNYFSKQKALVMLDKTKVNGVPINTVTTDNPADETAAIIVKEYHRYVDTHTSRDVMTMITKALTDWKAVTLRETGGIYWVPRTMSENVKKLQNAIEQLGKSLVFILPVHETADSARSLGMAAAGSIEADLEALGTEITGFVEEGPESVRKGTLDRRLGQFEDLRNRAELYRSILGVTVNDLDAKLAQMTEAVQTLLAQKQD